MKLNYFIPVLLSALVACSALAGQNVIDEMLPLTPIEEKMHLKALRELTEKNAYLNEKLSRSDDHSEPLRKLLNWNDTRGTNYITSHTYAWHFVTYISNTGNYVTLEDGSGWLVSPMDAEKTLDWQPSDVILVSPAPWFTFYEYMLINNHSGDRVLVTFKKKPRELNMYTLYLLEIDPVNKTVVLNDESEWSVLWLDQWTLSNWQVGQRVILGINSGWFSSANPNVMINIETGEYIKGRCLY